MAARMCASAHGIDRKSIVRKRYPPSFLGPLYLHSKRGHLAQVYSGQRCLDPSSPNEKSEAADREGLLTAIQLRVELVLDYNKRNSTHSNNKTF